MSEDWDDRLADTLLDEAQRDQIEAYAARGRPFQPLTVDALSHAWAAACIDVAFGDDGQLVELSFLAAELVARDLHPPEELVPPQARQALHGRIASSTPPRFQAVTNEIGRAHRRLADQWLGARHSRGASSHGVPDRELPARIMSMSELEARGPTDHDARRESRAPSDDSDPLSANCANCANRPTH